MAGLVGPSTARLLLSDLLYRIEFLEEGAHSPYVVYLLRSGSARFQIRRDATGTSASMKKIAQSDIRELLLAFPPLPEQRAIAAFLDRETAKIDGLVTEAESAITLLQERRSALISAAVTGQIDVRNAVATEAA
jgi:type I restriction enzyme S subunit